MEPAYTVVPATFSIGIDSPVMRAWSTKECPDTTSHSVGGYDMRGKRRRPSTAKCPIACVASPPSLGVCEPCPEPFNEGSAMVHGACRLLPLAEAPTV